MLICLFFTLLPPSSSQNKASQCLLGNTCIRLDMLRSEGHTPVSNWNAIMYELTWLQGWGGEGLIGRWMSDYDVCLFHSSTVDIPKVMGHEWIDLPPSGRQAKSWVPRNLTVPRVENVQSIIHWQSFVSTRLAHSFPISCISQRLCPKPLPCP